MFEPILKPDSLNEIAYKNLKRAIIEGRLEKGKVHKEYELARNLGISRTPIREALLRLSAENLVILHPRKGMTVNFLDQKDIESLFELRQAMEETAVAKIAGKLTNDQIQELKKLSDNTEKFHMFLMAATDNRFIVQTFNNVKNFIEMLAKEAILQQGRKEEAVLEHEAIINALAKGDAREAKDAVGRHLMNTKLLILKSRNQKGANSPGEGIIGNAESIR